MHNNQKFIMSDPLFSVTNPLFFLYHSWIDVQLEMKVRVSHNSSNAQEMMDYLALPSGRSRLTEAFKKRGESTVTNGNYLIYEWHNPQKEEDVVAFFNA
jgi:hypothetical protein